MSESIRASIPAPSRIANRYDVLGRLGRGGMAAVYRVRDAVNGQELALKQLRGRDSAEKRARMLELFEREFHTLAQLAHPRVIAVHDYGLDEAGPYYTMELLDGGDLLDLSPLPWRQACALLLEVCSSLALLHSRRLLHRDVSPRNVRCTRDGAAKLIDFGAMAPMTHGGQVVGTPAFCAPESLQRSALDARADLFSLGATLYYALTGRMAYPARSFAEMLESFARKPAPPSASVPEIPPALDELVLSLLAIEPALRPRNAYEVMQRLSAIAGLAQAEPEGVARAYLAAPQLVGREQPLHALRGKLNGALRGRGGGTLIRAEAGLGRSRMLDACALEAKTLGAIVLRAGASGAEEPFAVAFALLAHALQALPSESLPAQFPLLFERGESAVQLRAHARDGKDAQPLQEALVHFLLSVSRTHALLIAVDDVERCDEPSAAVLGRLCEKARRRALLLALTADASSSGSFALEALARRCTALSLAPLDREQTQQLLGSLFGDVANLHMLADEVHTVAQGNPRTTMDVAQHLVDRKVIAYAAGTWTLPVKIAASDLPESGKDAIRARIAAFAPVPRALAQAHALALHEQLSHEQYRALLPAVEPRHVDDAVALLLASDALSGDGASYALSNRLWREALRESIAPEELPERHRALAAMYRGRSLTAVVHHAFSAGDDEQGLDALIERHAEYERSFDSNAVIALNAGSLGPSYLRAIETAERLKRPVLELLELQRWLTALSIVAEPRYYWLAAPAWLARMERDSGLADYRADNAGGDAGERLMRALTAAQQRYQALPEHERGYPVDQALRMLAQYVALSIAIGVRMLDVPLLKSLPGLLEPFVALSPLLEAIWQNARATLEGTRDGCWERARERWLGVYQKLGEPGAAELQHADTIRNAVAYAIGMTELGIGLPTASTWAARLDAEATQRVSAMYLRKIVRLEQGDFSGADRAQRQAELLQLQTRAPQMFDSLLYRELYAYTHARDLGGIKDVMVRIEACAGRSQEWQAVWLLAQGRFALVRGDLERARQDFERCYRMCEAGALDGSGVLVTWVEAKGSLAETLLLLGDNAAARACADGALAVGTPRELDSQLDDLVRARAIALARLGEQREAQSSLEALIAKQEKRGVGGLKLGLSYEARAQVALAGSDSVAFERYALRAAREYGQGAHSPLSARYERLVDEAQRRGLRTQHELSDLLPSSSLGPSRTEQGALGRTVRQAFYGASDPNERALRALRLICDARTAHVAHCYLLQPDGGLEHAATFGPSDPPARLGELARDFLRREESRAETRTIAATSTTSALSAAESRVEPLIKLGGELYELLPLTCVQSGMGVCTGVVALALPPNSAPVRAGHQAQLLAAIASHFVTSPTTTG